MYRFLHAGDFCTTFGAAIRSDVFHPVGGRAVLAARPGSGAPWAARPERRVACMKLRDLIQELSEVKTWEKPRVELEQYPTPPDIAAHMLFAAVEEGDVEDSLVADLGCGGCILGIAAALMGAAHVTGVDIDPAALSVAAENVAEAEVSVDLVLCDVTQLAMRGLGECGGASSHGVGDAGSGSGGGGCGDSTALGSGGERAAEAPAAVAVVAEEDAETETEADADAAKDEGGEALPPIGRGVYDLVLMNPPFGTQKDSGGVDMRFLRAGLGLCAAEGAVYSLHKTSTRAYIAKRAAAWGVACRVVAELHFEIPKMYKHHKHASLDVAVDFWRFSPKSDDDDEDGDETTAASALQGLILSGVKGGGKGGGKGGKGKGRGRGDEREGGRGGGGRGGGGRGSRKDGADGPRSKQECRAHAKARLEHFGGGGGNKREGGARVTKIG